MEPREMVRKRAVRQMERLREMLEDGDISLAQFNREYGALARAHFPEAYRAANPPPASRPRGIADVGIRQWSCSICGAHHDRDVMPPGTSLPVPGMERLLKEPRREWKCRHDK